MRRARLTFALIVTSCSLPDVVVVASRDAEVRGPDGVLRGSVRFLQGDELVLDSQAGTVVVTQNGPFSFPRPIPRGSSYAVRVLQNPSGQHCAIRGGGDGAFDPARAVEVVCVVATQRSVWGGTIVHAEESWLPLDGLSSITLRVTEPSHALVWLHATSVDFENTHLDARGNVLRLAVTEGERTVAEAVVAGGAWDTPRPAHALSLVELSPGEHTLRARMGYERRPVPGVTLRPLRARIEPFNVSSGPGLIMGAIVLESLGAFASVVRASSPQTGSVPEGASAAPFGPGDRAITVNERQPALTLLHVPELHGAPAVELRVDDAVVSAARYTMNAQGAAATLMGFTELAPGPHTLSTRWTSWFEGASASGAEVMQGAVLFRPSLTWVQQVRAEAMRVQTEKTEPLPSMQFTVPREGRALLGFQIPQYYLEPFGRYGWVRMKLDGAPVSGCALWGPPGGVEASLPCAMLSLVDVLPGEHTVAFEVATYETSQARFEGPLNVFAMLVE